LECRDGGRVDVKLDADGKPAFMEINTLPGLHPTHSDLLAAIIDSARSRIRVKT